MPISELWTLDGVWDEFNGEKAEYAQMQSDAHVSQLFDRQQRRDDVLPKAVVDQHLASKQRQDHGLIPSPPEDTVVSLSEKTVPGTFHTGSDRELFRGGALKFSIRFKDAAGNRHHFNHFKHTALSFVTSKYTHIKYYVC